MCPTFFRCDAGINCFSTKFKGRVTHAILLDPKIPRSNMARR
jgi:hypothetical protein